MDRQRQEEVLSRVFTWHPNYRGKSRAEVLDELRTEIARDQQTFLSTRIGSADEARAWEIDRKWKAFDQAWFGIDADELAPKVLGLEVFRDSLKKMYTMEEWQREKHKQERFEALHGHPMRNIDVWQGHIVRWGSYIAVGVLIGWLLLKIL